MEDGIQRSALSSFLYLLPPVARLQKAEQVMTNSVQRSYLLRLWSDHVGAPMRATLIAIECPDKPRHFASMDELFVFLSVQAYPAAPADDRLERDAGHCTPYDVC